MFSTSICKYFTKFLAILHSFFSSSKYNCYSTALVHLTALPFSHPCLANYAANLVPMFTTMLPIPDKV